MNQFGIDYLNRFDLPKKQNLSSFYTGLDVANYHLELPYLLEVEFFCLRAYQALLKNQKITIYSDYDTDAVTATGVMYHGLLDLGFESKNIDFYAPDRFVEGYGMNLEAVDKLCKSSELIISVDCGINSVAEAELVRKSPNTELIITDHHHLSGELPVASAVVNPRLAELWHSNSESIKNLDSFSRLVEFLDPEFLEKYKKRISEARQKQNYLPTTVTGVGVAWFCLVWLGYFLQEVGS